MLPDRVSNPGPLTYESGALQIALRSPAQIKQISFLASASIEIYVIEVKKLSRIIIKYSYCVELWL